MSPLSSDLRLDVTLLSVERAVLRSLVELVKDLLRPVRRRRPPELVVNLKEVLHHAQWVSVSARGGQQKCGGARCSAR